ncbi:GIY-YIG nuclease family protein [Pararcticibacter amylolyticus]|uniref:Nuclease n=1 Tax=Pararcticibacter amylolyticus TaxID=2173175 RepID=A0A2U2PKU9_9SPHI|nr:nuclease [Pararcticibacter amylolyticus]PWG81892.1 nuclease [Pararcticibacter amylolyticus]
MKRYVYIITDRNRSSLHVGMSADLLKTISFYRQMPSLFFDGPGQLSRLVYFEELRTEEAALQRFNLISKFTRAQKEKLLREVNPDWLDLSLGLDYENMILSAGLHRQHVPVRIKKAA